MIGICIWKFYRDEIIIENLINVWSICIKLDLYEFYFRFLYLIFFFELKVFVYESLDLLLRNINVYFIFKEFFSLSICII